MNRLDNVARCRVVASLIEGMSIRATVTTTGAAKNTVTKLLVGLGAACSEYMDRAFRDLGCRRIQVDECRAFRCAKAKDVKPENLENGRYSGDVWTWAAIDADTKLIPCWTLGQRDMATASEFVAELASRLSDRVQLGSDGLSAYLGAVTRAFHGSVEYAQLFKIHHETSEGLKRNRLATCIGCKGQAVMGKPDPGHIGASYIERADLTKRTHIRRFTQLTGPFSKKIENHTAAVALHLMHYNFSRVDQTLKTSPAVAAGAADHVWTLAEIVSLLDRSERIYGGMSIST